MIFSESIQSLTHNAPMFMHLLQHQSSIRIPGSEVIPVPLFHTLDGTRTEDYVARVEPSASGGRKMAEYLLDAMRGSGGGAAQRSGGAAPVSAPTASFIDGRTA